MRLPRARLTLRKAMALVGVSAVLLWAGGTAVRLYYLGKSYKSKSLRCLAEASVENSSAVLETSDHFLKQTSRLLGATSKGDDPGDLPGGMTDLGDEAGALGARLRARKLRVVHWLGLAEKYRLAAERPWLPVEPDPEEPPLPPKSIAVRPNADPESATQGFPRSNGTWRQRVYD